MPAGASALGDIADRVKCSTGNPRRTAVANTGGSVAPTWDAPDDHRVTGCKMLRRQSSAGQTRLELSARAKSKHHADFSPHLL